MLNFIMKINDWYERKSTVWQIIIQVIAAIIIVTLTMLIGTIWTVNIGMIFYFTVWFICSFLCLIVERKKFKEKLFVSKEEN